MYLYVKFILLKIKQTRQMNAKPENWAVMTRKNTKNLAFWTLTWVLTMAVASFGPKLIWNFDTTISTVVIALNTLIGVGMIQSNRRYLNGLDEMQRKLSLEAMAIALGVGVVARSAGKGGVPRCAVTQGCSPLAEGTGASGMECQSLRVRHP